MSRISIALLVVVVIAIALIAWCRQEPDRAIRISAQSGNPEQTRLWEDVSQRGVPDAVNRLPIAPAPTDRQSPQPPSQPVAPVSTSLAPGVITAASVVSTSRSGEWQYSGDATVAGVAGEQVEVILSDGARITFLARVAGNPLSVAVKENVSVYYSSKPDLFGGEHILAVETGGGTIVITAAKDGDAPISLNVPVRSLTLAAAQMIPGAKGAVPLLVQVGPAKDVIPPGTEREVGGLWISVLGSFAEPGAAGLDGSPYAVSLQAWRVGK